MRRRPFTAVAHGVRSPMSERARWTAILALATDLAARLGGRTLGFHPEPIETTLDQLRLALKGVTTPGFPVGAASAKKAAEVFIGAGYMLLLAGTPEHRALYATPFGEMAKLLDELMSEQRTHEAQRASYGARD